MSLADLFPGADFRFGLNLRRGQATDFFSPTAEAEALLTERRQILETSPELHAGFPPGSETILASFVEWLRSNHLLKADILHPTGMELGRILEPDFLLVEAGAGRRLIGGCVCFPTAWALPEKLGRPLAEIHQPVPTLNPKLGQAIGRALEGLRPEQPLTRENWGLTASPERNQIPSQNLPKLGLVDSLASVWLRIEHQIFLALPAGAGLAFAIRISSHRLCDVLQSAPERAGLRRALQSMPEEIARYKGLAAVRPALLRLLE